MKNPRRCLKIGAGIVGLILAFPLSGNFLLGQQIRREAAAEISRIDAEIVQIKKEIPSLEKQLVESRKEYEERVAKPSKGVVMVCGDSTSDNLADFIKLNHEMIDNLQKAKKQFAEIIGRPASP